MTIVNDNFSKLACETTSEKVNAAYTIWTTQQLIKR